jgi:hypothetical protein
VVSTMAIKKYLSALTIACRVNATIASIAIIPMIRNGKYPKQTATSMTSSK